MAKMVSAYKCPVCNKEQRYGGIYRTPCYCQAVYTHGKGYEGLVEMEPIKRPLRVVKGPFKISGFQNLGFGRSAQIILEKDGENFEVRFKSVAHLVIGKAELDITLYETYGDSWSINGYSDDYIWIDNLHRPKIEVEDTFTVTGFKYVSSTKPGRYARTILTSSKGIKYEVFSKDLKEEHMMKIISGEPLKIREDKRSGSYKWLIVE